MEEYITPKNITGVAEEDKQKLRKEDDKLNSEEKQEKFQEQSHAQTSNHTTQVIKSDTQRSFRFPTLKELRKINILKNSIPIYKFQNNRGFKIEQIPFEYLNEIFENLYKEEV